MRISNRSVIAISLLVASFVFALGMLYVLYWLPLKAEERNQREDWAAYQIRKPASSVISVLVPTFALSNRDKTIRCWPDGLFYSPQSKLPIYIAMEKGIDVSNVEFRITDTFHGQLRKRAVFASNLSVLTEQDGFSIFRIEDDRKDELKPIGPSKISVVVFGKETEVAKFEFNTECRLMFK